MLQEGGELVCILGGWVKGGDGQTAEPPSVDILVGWDGLGMEVLGFVPTKKIKITEKKKPKEFI